MGVCGVISIGVVGCFCYGWFMGVGSVIGNVMGAHDGEGGAAPAPAGAPVSGHPTPS